MRGPKERRFHEQMDEQFDAMQQSEVRADVANWKRQRMFLFDSDETLADEETWWADSG